MKVHALLFATLAVAGLCSPAGAKTVTVSQDATSSATTFVGALALAVDGDTILFRDSGTYSETINVPLNPGNVQSTANPNTVGFTNLTITNLPGTTPVIEKNGGANQMIRYTPKNNETGTLQIIGADANSPITLRHSLNATPNINTGPNVNTQHSLVLSNIVLDKPAGQTNPTWLNINNAGTHVLNNVKFTGGGSGVSGGFVAVLGNISTTLAGTITGTGLDLRAGLTGGRVGFTAVAGSTVTLNSSIIEPAAGQNARGITATAPGTLILNDCSIKSVNDTQQALERFFSSALTLVQGGLRIVMNRPVITGHMGDVAFGQGSAAPGALTLEIAGTPTAKVNFNPMNVGGTILPFRLINGTVKLTDCQGTVAAAGGNMLDTAFEGVLQGPVSVTMDRCDWRDGAGNVSMVATDAGGAPVASAFPVALDAVNTIWRGSGPVGSILNTLDSLRSSTGTITLTHVTMYGAAPGAFIANSNTLGGQVVTDLVTINDSVFDDSQTQAVSLSTPLLQANNVVRKAGSLAGGGFTLGEAVGVIVGDPLLLSNGRLLNGSASPAIDAATSSTLAIDIDGRTRPDGAANDMGASEAGPLPNSARFWEALD